MELMIFILEIIGTVAFSISGAVAAMDSDMDLLGIAVLGMTTAVGGGIVRDIVLGATPPNAFRQPVYLLISLATIVLLLIGVQLWKNSDRLPNIISPHLIGLVNASDAIGLGAFTMTGANVAINMGYGEGMLLVVFVAMLTGVGGGVMRDLFTMKKPYIFMKHIYAFASLIGAVMYFILRHHINANLAMALSAGAIVLIRYISARYNLSLPKFNFRAQ